MKSQNRFFLFVLLGLLFPAPTFSKSNDDAPISLSKLKGPSAELIRFRHVEPKGIGYSSGYSSIDLFFSIPNFNRKFVPFLDFRGHIFNNGKYAANLGIGVRMMQERFRRIVGLNCVYDYRLTSRKVYNQGAIGLESLGEKWDLRVNGYFQCGANQTAPYDFGYNMNTYVLTANKQAPMNGFDTELGYRITSLPNYSIYTASGLYYYHADPIKTTTIGGMVRAQATVYNYLTLEVKGSYDHFFHWIGQAALSLNVPLGYRKMPPERSFGLQEALLSPIQHNEIIVVGQKRITL